VLDETYTLLLSALAITSVELGERSESSRLVSVVIFPEDLEEEAWQLFKQYADKEFTTDFTSFAEMRADIWEAFTTDYHFEQAGYQRLLK